MPLVGWTSLVAQMVKDLPAMQETQVPSLGGEDPLEKEMATHSNILAWTVACQVPLSMKFSRQPTPIFLPGEFHGQRNLAGYSPWGHKESDMTEQLTLSHSLKRT